jgi:hypothetical protein
MRSCWTMVLPRLMGHPLTIQNSDENFRAKTVDTCIRRNKVTIMFVFVSTKIFLFPHHFKLLPFPFHCLLYFSETKLGQSEISVIVFTSSKLWTRPLSYLSSETCLLATQFHRILQFGR